MLLSLLRHVVPINGGNCRLIMLVDKGRYTPDAPPHTFDIGVFKTFKKDFTTIKRVHN